MCFIPLSAQYYLDDFVYGVVICTFHDQAKKNHIRSIYCSLLECSTVQSCMHVCALSILSHNKPLTMQKILHDTLLLDKRRDNGAQHKMKLWHQVHSAYMDTK